MSQQRPMPLSSLIVRSFAGHELSDLKQIEEEFLPRGLLWQGPLPIAIISATATEIKFRICLTKKILVITAKASMLEATSGGVQYTITGTGLPKDQKAKADIADSLSFALNTRVERNPLNGTIRKAR